MPHLCSSFLAQISLHAAARKLALLSLTIVTSFLLYTNPSPVAPSLRNQKEQRPCSESIVPHLYRFLFFIVYGLGILEKCVIIFYLSLDSYEWIHKRDSLVVDSSLYYSSLGCLVLQLVRKDPADLSMRSTVQVNTFPKGKIHQGKWSYPVALV